MSENTIVYFHGFGSSPNSDKVNILKQHFKDVYAFPIDVDPEKSLPYLEEEIDNLLTDTIHQEGGLVFVGTSLGAWYAGRMGLLYDVPAVLINPAYSFKHLKQELPIPENIKNCYEEKGFVYPKKKTKFFISSNDELINFDPFLKDLSKLQVTIYSNTDHRFNGIEFHDVIDYIKTLT